MIKLVKIKCKNKNMWKVYIKNSAKIIFACLTKTCLFVFNLKFNLPIEIILTAAVF